MNIRLSIFSLLLALVLGSCNESEPQPGEPQPDSPTPYQLETPDYFSNNFQIPEDNPLTEEGVALGRMLFYEPLLSGDNSLSCASCHQQEAAFSDQRRFSLGVNGTPSLKNSMALGNLLWSSRFFWDGRESSLEVQALDPIQNPIEMNESLENCLAELQATDRYPPLFEAAFGDSVITTENLAKAIAQFERTLISSNSKYDQYLRGEYQPTALELQGIELFYTHPVPEIGLRGGNCGDCHVGVLAAGDPTDFSGFHNNGLDTDENLEEGLASVTGRASDKGKFKAVSLRNIALTPPYMHDGRFNTLEEVLDHYNDHVQDSETLDPLILEASNEFRNPDEPVLLHLTDEEKAAIIAFLNMLTDEEFVRNPKFSDPF